MKALQHGMMRPAFLVACCSALARQRGFGKTQPADERRAKRLGRAWPEGAVAAPASAASWDEVASRLGDAATRAGAVVAADNASVVFWRDSAHWCPYCAAVEIVLSERQIDHAVRLAPMRCYGVKPEAFVEVAGDDGTMPVVVVDGVVHRSSLAALAALCDEVRFPAPRHPSFAGPERGRRFAVERELAAAYVGWLLDERRGAARTRFYAALDAAERALGSEPFFGGAAPSCADATLAPTLERAAAVAAYFKGEVVAGGRVRPDDELAAAPALGDAAAVDHPRLQAWAERVARRGWTRSDWYTHAHTLPAQLGGRRFAGPSLVRDLVDAHARVSSTAASEPRGRRAAALLARNARACIRFAARGCRRPTKRADDRTRAPLADYDVANDVPSEAFPAIDALLRLAALKLLAAGDASEDAAVAAAARDAAGTVPRAPAAAALAYLRDRVGVPRDAAHPEASELRAALAWLHDVLLEPEGAVS